MVGEQLAVAAAREYQAIVGIEQQDARRRVLDRVAQQTLRPTQVRNVPRGAAVAAEASLRVDLRYSAGLDPAHAGGCAARIFEIPEGLARDGGGRQRLQTGGIGCDDV